MQLDFGINTGLVEELYARYLENRDSVDPAWRAYFDSREGRLPARGEQVRRAPQAGPSPVHTPTRPSAEPASPVARPAPPPPSGNGNGLSLIHI